MNPRAFTIIEMLLASALCATLMVALLSICTTMARSDRAMKHQLPVTDHAAFIDLLRRDLAQAQTLIITANELILTGHGGLSEGTLETNHQSVRVTYRLVQTNADSQSADAGSTGLLTREESHPNELNNRNRWSECAALDVKRFEVKPIEVRTSNPSKEVTDSAPFPAAVHVELEWSKLGQPALSTVIFTR